MAGLSYVHIVGGKLTAGEDAWLLLRRSCRDTLLSREAGQSTRMFTGGRPIWLRILASPPTPTPVTYRYQILMAAFRH